MKKTSRTGEGSPLRSWLPGAHNLYRCIFFFFLILCSLVTENTAMKKNSEIPFHLVVLHATPSPSNDWVPNLVYKTVSFLFKWLHCRPLSLLPNMCSNPEVNKQTLPSTCKSLACYKVGSSPISDELSYSGSQSTERLHPGGSVCGHCDNSEMF